MFLLKTNKDCLLPVCIPAFELASCVNMSKNQCDAISNWNLYLPRKKWNKNLCDEVFCRVVGDAKDLCTGHQGAGQKRPFVQTGTRIEANRRTVKQKVHVQMTPEWNSGRKFSPEKSWCPTVWGWRQSKTGPGWHKSSKLQRACDTLCWCRISPDRVLLESHLMITSWCAGDSYRWLRRASTLWGDGEACLQSEWWEELGLEPFFVLNIIGEIQSTVTFMRKKNIW